ncbi:FAD/NAD(P)-binding protein [Hymenobacter ginsengisoli]|uniref:FAD/NAD(P)-binding protein n=1 Tax=Hymenobacter ginsengisoli TaxID=1051626 RepID=A0ABP8PX03_9BACT|nr:MULTISPECIES: FAD/NAD(P)-binding protein [unclassified Hymenobacter]MBO2030286.1 FAD/NAD(P)-binding protein [Hymenobacter sp. BT559]
MPPAAPYQVTIIGGGFAGTALALHLARQPGPLPMEVALVEPRATPGPGLAYSAQRPELLLNVRPRSLSVWADAPDHFAHWLARQPEAVQGLPEFAPRATYGRYLAEELATALAHPAANGVRISHYPSEALAAPLLPDGRRAVQLADGRTLASHATVLALGNFPPPPPTGPDHRYLHHPGYHADPWVPGTLASIGAHEPVLLIGAGLTAVDMLLALRAQGHLGPVQVVARRGSWPAVHGPAGAPAYPNFYSEMAAETTVAGTLRHLRHHLALAAAQGIDWRAVIDTLRPDLGRIWAGWPVAEQARFLRHLAGRWAQARHRMAPSHRALLTELTASAQLHTVPGRALEIVPAEHLLRVGIAQAGRPWQWLAVPHVICCAGPLLDYSRLATPLVQQLRADGCLVPDALRLGISTDADGALLGPAGQPSAGGLFTLGASRRPAYFESTAVPELRQQAAALAATLAQRYRAAQQ